MKKKLKIIRPIGLLLAVILLSIGQSAWAFNDQTNSALSETINSGFLLGQTLGPGDGTRVSKITVKVGANENLDLYFCEYDTAINSQRCGASTTGESGRKQITGVTADASGFYAWDFSNGSTGSIGTMIGQNPVTASASKFYSIGIKHGGGVNVKGAGLPSPDQYPAGYAVLVNTGTLATSTTVSVLDAYFTFPNILPALPTPELTYPDTTPLPDFEDWEVTLHYPTSTTAYVGVAYSRTSSSTFTYFDEEIREISVSGNPAPDIELDIAKSQTLWFAPLATSTTWYAKAYYRVGTTTTYGDLETFTINLEANNTPSSFGSTIDCSGYEGGFFSSSTLPAIGCYAKQAAFATAQFLFVPGQNSMAFFKTTYDNFQNVFPFSLFFGTINKVETAVNNYDSSGSSLTWNLKTPIGTSTVTYLTSTTLRTVAGSTFTNWLFNLLLMVMTIVMVFGWAWVIFGNKHKKDHRAAIMKR